MTADVAEAERLSAVLRARTSQAHASVERSPFLTALLAGRVGRAGAAALLGRLAPVYAALEQTARTWQDDPVVGPFLLPGLERSASLAADLRTLGAGEVRSPAATAYADRLRGPAAAGRAAFLAHHHTRCLGDLSGGQQMGAALARSLDLPGGLAFFTPQLPPAETRRQYRSLLDAAPLLPAERDALVAEALVAYRLNVALLAELDACS